MNEKTQAPAEDNLVDLPRKSGTFPLLPAEQAMLRSTMMPSQQSKLELANNDLAIMRLEAKREVLRKTAAEAESAVHALITALGKSKGLDPEKVSFSPDAMAFEVI